MKTNELVKILARDLRKNQTNAERLLWEKLRNRQFIGLKFTRQHPIFYNKKGLKKFIIADFFCNELKLILELDGKIHKKRKDYDTRREELLDAKNVRILRFKNDEIENNIKKSLTKLKRYINKQIPTR